MKNGKKKVQTLKWATAHLSIKLGARRRLGRWTQARTAQRGRIGARGTARTHRRSGHDAGREALRHGRLSGHDTATAHGLGVPVCRLGMLAGSAGLCVCRLCTRPVFGLSTVSESLFWGLFMNTVHHKNFSKKKLKKIKIKSNKMRQNFRKNEIFKNKIFVDKKNDLICGIIVSHCI